MSLKQRKIKFEPRIKLNHNIFMCTRKKMNNIMFYFVTSKDSGLIWLLGMIKISCNVHVQMYV